MRKIMIILGVLFTLTILLSGSAVAQYWHYADHVEFSVYCINPDWAVGQPNGYHATVGDYPYPGMLMLDLDSGNEMQPGQVFWVFASSSVEERYSVWVGVTTDALEYVGEDEDTTNHYFTTPTTLGKEWRYILILLESGTTGLEDPFWGPEIDAVGWY